MPRRILLAPAVASELLYMFVDEAHSRREAIDNAMLAREGVVHASVDLSDDERIAAVRFA
jgi:hypothetical protein